VFAVGVAIVRKVQEAQEQRRRDAMPKLPKSELPEATRRQIYGEQPAQEAAPESPVRPQRQPVPQPAGRNLREPSCDTPPAVPARRNASGRRADAPARRPVPAEEVPERTPRPWEGPAREILRELLGEALPAPPPRRPVYEPASAPCEGVPEKKAAPEPRKQCKKPVAAAEPAPMSVHTLLTQPEGLMWSIALREILGPPKALQD